MRTADTLETRDAGALLQRCNLMQRTRGWVRRHRYTPGVVVKRLEKRPDFPSLLFSLFLPCVRSLARSFSPSLLFANPPSVVCRAFLHPSRVQRPRTIREMEKTLVREAGEIGCADRRAVCLRRIRFYGQLVEYCGINCADVTTVDAYVCVYFRNIG